MPVHPLSTLLAASMPPICMRRILRPPCGLRSGSVAIYVLSREIVSPRRHLRGLEEHRHTKKIFSLKLYQVVRERYYMKTRSILPFSRTATLSLFDYPSHSVWIILNKCTTLRNVLLRDGLRTLIETLTKRSWLRSMTLVSHTLPVVVVLPQGASKARPNGRGWFGVLECPNSCLQFLGAAARAAIVR